VKNTCAAAIIHQWTSFRAEAVDPDKIRATPRPADSAIGAVTKEKPAHSPLRS
jgi:hypothetical protein